MHLKDLAEVTGNVDSYHAFRGGYWLGAMGALDALEQLLAADVDVDTALDELQTWLTGDDFGQWVNAPDDPQAISPRAWLARLNESSMPEPGKPA